MFFFSCHVIVNRCHAVVGKCYVIVDRYHAVVGKCYVIVDRYYVIVGKVLCYHGQVLRYKSPQTLRHRRTDIFRISVLLGVNFKTKIVETILYINIKRL